MQRDIDAGEWQMTRMQWLFVAGLALVAAGCSEESKGAPPAQELEDAGAPDAQDDTPDAQGDTPDADPGDADQPDEEVGEVVCGDLVCDPGESCEVDCTPAPVSLHDPRTGVLLAFPDEYFVVEDPETPNGVRVEINEENLGSILTFPAGFRGVFTELSQLDGFGTSAGGFLSFSKALDPDSLPSGLASAQDDSAVIFGHLGPEGLVRVPVEVKLTDEGRTVVLRPMAPLPPGVQAVAAVTTAARGVDGAPCQPGDWTRTLLSGQGPAGLQGRVEEAVEALVDAGAVSGPEALASLLVFTTQSITDQSEAIAQDIRERAPQVTGRPGCQIEDQLQRCQVTFEVGDYRDEARVLDLSGGVTPRRLYELTAEVYLPLEAGEYGTPYPVIIFGHGLAGDRSQARALARFAAPRGIATVAIDAPEHGEHPARTGRGDASTLLNFFGFDAGFTMHALALRDNFRQAAWDKLSLVQLIVRGLDADGDGEVELDGERLMYLGVSLGGIMGPELLALSPEIGAAVLVVPGGRMTDIMQFGELFAPLVRLLTPNGLGAGDVDRFWPILQTAVERGDAANWGPRVLRDRLAGEPQDVLVGIVLDDDIVPEAANFLLARAMNIPHMPPRLREIGLIPEGAALPATDNLPGGVTAGLLQFDVVVRGGQEEPATHNNIGGSEVGAEAWLQFLDAWLVTGSATIVDPYETLGLRP